MYKPPCELSRLEIRRIYDETGVEIESFIHGALCYCYSGQCLMKQARLVDEAETVAAVHSLVVWHIR